MGEATREDAAGRPGRISPARYSCRFQGTVPGIGAGHCVLDSAEASNTAT